MPKVKRPTETYPPMAITVKGAWLTYLRTTQHLQGLHYSQTEPWAWDRLQHNLYELKQRVPA